MTDKNHPITPPPELILNWMTSYDGYEQAARWGADKGLEACCKVIDAATAVPLDSVEWLRNARRPKPPSLKEQALKTIVEMANCMKAGFIPKRNDLDIIRRAIESLPS